MNDPNSQPNASEPPQAAPVTGKLLRETRLAAKIEATKVCNDLRISLAVLEALENSHYHLLPGDPYIRALLGSLGRYLNLDPQALIAGYNKDIGTVQATPAISPYKDRAHTHTSAHKQIFIVIFIGLFIVLFLIIGKLNKGEPDPSKLTQPMNSAPAESIAIPVDTGLESNSLVPDSIAIKVPADAGIDTAKFKVAPIPMPAPVSGAGTPAAPITNSALVLPPGLPTPPPVQQPAPQPAPPASAGAALTAQTAPLQQAASGSAVIKPLFDKVGIKVLRKGKDDFLAELRLGKQMQLSFQDTVIVFTSKRKSVEVTVDGKSVIPEKKMFRIYGNTLKVN